MNIIYYLIIINIISFLLCFLDKRFAIRKMYRIPEAILLLVSLLGGCFAFLLGMNIFHHKTKKLKFKLIYLFCLIWLFLIYKIYF
jgi:uncharacterized membrane protein YsdA (DUF1294 family)